MKKEANKKSKLWILIVAIIAALLLVVTAVVGVFGIPALLALFGGSGDPSGDATPQSPVYWNLDRVQYTQDSETGLSTREKGEDGLYHLRMICGGQIIDMTTTDKQLVNFADTMDAMGLVLDENGLIIDVLNVKDIATETAKNFYVKAINGNTVTVNSSIAMNGMDIQLAITDAASITDVRADSETLGQKIVLDIMDMVCVYSNSDGVVTDIFMLDRPAKSDLYLRVDRLYDTATAMTTREPDENGVYTIPFAVGGKVVELKCKDKNLVTAIDAGTDSNQVMGLVFDEEGYITDKILAATAIRGKIACLVYNVTAINGTTIEATRLMSGSEQGKVVTFNMAEDTEIVMNETGCNHFIGEYVPEIKMNDRIVVWVDMDNNAKYIKIDRRQVDAPMYYLQKRMWNSTTLETNRVPVNGYYVFELASKGKMVTVKTKDKELANKLDANTWQFFGLKVENGIIKEYYDANCISAGYGIGGQRFVTQVMASIVRIVSGSDFNSGGNYMLTPETEIYDMTGAPGTKLGSKTTLQEGDRVIANRSVDNNITHIYVLDRYQSGCKLYYNASRKYNSTTLETSRVPEVEGENAGYYVFTMYCEGKEVIVKTKDKAIATIIDAQNAPIVALKVSKDNIVKAAYPAIAGQKFTAKVFNYNYVGEITADKTVSCYYFSNGERFEASASYKMAKNCKVYNVTNNVKSHRGEKSSVKVGDRIQALRNIETGELTHIWIMGRMYDAPLYFHVNRKAPVNGETVREPDADGYYSVELFVDGKIKTFRTKDKKIMSQVDTYGSETFFTLETNGDIILKTGNASESKRAVNQVVSHWDITKISGKKLTLTRMRPGQTNTGDTKEVTYTGKTQIYDVCYYSENQFKAAKLEKGDRVVVYADLNGNVTYIFVMYTHTRVNGYESKCPHCNKVVWWEPWLGAQITTAELVHFYLPTDRTRSQGQIGRDETTYPDALHNTVVFDMNGCTLTSTTRNFLVYSDLILIDTVGGGVLEAQGASESASGGNFLVPGGTVEVYDGITIRRAENPKGNGAGSGANFNVSNKAVQDADGKTLRTYTGKVTIHDAVLEAWPGVATDHFQMNAGTVLNIKGGTIKGGTVDVFKGTTFNWTGGKIESNINLNGATMPLVGVPNFSGMLLTSNGGKVDISKLSTSASIKALPSGVFTTESDNIDAYLNVFKPAVDTCSIVKEGKALSATVATPTITENLQFVPGTQLAACPRCESIVSWTPLTQAEYGQNAYGNTGNGMHLYLAEDIVYEGSSTFMNAPSRDAAKNVPYHACFHLNGHNFTATNSNVAHGSYGALHILGSGTVSGNGKAGATITINTNINCGGGMFLHSGTYTKTSGNTTGVVQINANGGDIWVGKDATIVTDAKKLAAKVGGGNFISGRLIIEGTVKGGYVETTPETVKPDLECIVGLMLNGANLEGGAKIAKDTVLGVYGATKIGGSGLDLTSGAKIFESELTGDAKVIVQANGIFTEELLDAAGQLKYYEAEAKYKPVEIKDTDYLWSERDPSAPDYADEAVIPALPELLKVDNANLSLDANSQAKCPVCGEVVTWTAITDATAIHNLEGGNHYYLSESLIHEAAGHPFIQVASGKSACLHLNGNNIVATNAMAVLVNGQLNIMGNGTVSGNGYSSDAISSLPHLQAATIQINHPKAVLNLYGGTYVKSTENDARKVMNKGSEVSGANHIVGIHGNGGTLNMFEGVTIDARNTKKEGLRGFYGMFNMYGGTVYGGTVNAVMTGNWSTTQSGSSSIYGGKIIASSGGALLVGATASAPCSLNIYGGEMVGTVNYNANTEVIVAGKPVMNRFQIPTSKTGNFEGKITLGKLEEGASIAVTGGEGIFSFPFQNINTYATYFKGMSGYAVEVKDYALNLKKVTTPNPDQPDTPVIPADPKVPALPTLLEVDNSNLNLVDGKAKCPVCNEVVTWTPITNADITTENYGYSLVGGTHYYLKESVTYTGTNVAFGYLYDAAKKDVCFHLNGNNITSSGIAFFAGNHLNVMGNGTVTGNGKQNGRAATFDNNSSVALVNIYGGTYTKAANNDFPVVTINSAGGVVNIYKNVTIDGRNNKGDVVRGFNGTFNIYGGTVYGGTNGACVNAGNATQSGNAVAGTVNIFGGLLQATNGSGAAATGSASKKATLNIYGGEIKGTTQVKSISNVTIGGTAKLNRLHVDANQKITLAEMSEGASIYVIANGIFTNPSNNASTYVKYFHGFKQGTTMSYKTPTVVENALFTEEGTDEPGTEPEPEQPVAPKFDNSNLVFEEGTTNAKCPVCDKVVEWIPITQAGLGTTGVGDVTEAGLHYYLAEDITYTGTANFIRGPGSSKTLCVHLNGNNFTGSAAFLFGYGSKSRVMGNGIVANAKDSAKSGAIVWNTGTKTNVDIQLYGGTYTVAPGNVNGSAISIQDNGGDITIHEGVKVIGSATAPAIYVGTSNVRTSVLNIKGATIEGTLKIANCAVSKGFSTTVAVEDSIVSKVELGKDVSFTVNGNTEIHKLDVAEGAKFTVGTLGSKAKINVKGNGVISNANDKMSTYFGQFTSTYGCQLSVENNALVARDLNKISTAALSFTEGTTAVCPYCQKAVEWTAIKSTDTYLMISGNTHLYLAEDTTVTADSSKDGFLHMQFAVAKLATDKVCLHLNGHNLTVNGDRAIMAGPGNMYIMGQGTISGDNTNGSTIHINGTKGTGTVNLLGGTYVKPATNLKGNVAHIGGNGGTLNIYAGATIDGGNIESNEAAAVHAVGSTGSQNSGNAVINMYGGTIKDGNNAKSNGGNVRLNTAYATFNMYDGTVTGGKANGYYGGNIYSNLGDINLMGGTISNGAAKIGGNVSIQNTATDASGSLFIQNMRISNGTATLHGGSISSDYAPITIGVGTVIDGGHATGQGGNVRAYCANITMNGGVIYNGKADNAAGNGNVWIVSDKDAFLPVMRMNGGLIYGTSENAKHGNGIYVGSRATLYIANDASVIDAAGATVAGINVQSANSAIKFCDGWYGSASLRFASKYAAGATIPVANAQVVTVDANLNATAGGTVAGKILQINDGTLAIEPQADGSLKIAAAVVAE